MICRKLCNIKILFTLALFLNFSQIYAQKIDSLLNIADKFVDENEFDSAFHYIDIAKKTYNSEIDYAKIMKEEGTIYLALSDYANAIKLFMEAIRIAEANNDKRFVADIENELSVLYYETNEIEKAKKYITDAYRVMQEENYYDVYIALNYGVIMFFRTDFNKALAFFLDQRKNLSETDYRALSYWNNFIGHTYKENGDYEKALIFFKKALNYSQKRNDTIAMSLNYTTIAYCFLKMNMIDSAFFNIQKAVFFSEKINNAFAKKDAYEILSNIYYKKNDIKKYKETIEKLDKAKKELYGTEIKIAIAKTEYKNKIILLEKENQIKSSKIKTQFFIFTAIFIILLLILFVVIKRHKYKRIINEQKIKILQEKEINAKILNEKLQDELKMRSKELISKTMTVASYNELLEEIIKELQDVKIEEESEKEKIRKIINKIKLSSKDFWDDFFMFFNDIHKDFLSMLEKNYPDLTPTEKKIITLIKLNLSTKDISRLTYCSQRTVEKHRQNIRKKLSIDKKINLSDYISKMKTD